MKPEAAVYQVSLVVGAEPLGTNYYGSDIWRLYLLGGETPLAIADLERQPCGTWSCCPTTYHYLPQSPSYTIKARTLQDAVRHVANDFLAYRFAQAD